MKRFATEFLLIALIPLLLAMALLMAYHEDVEQFVREMWR